MTFDDRSFDDPTLKRALRDLYGSHKASPRLRASIVDTLRKGDAAPASSSDERTTAISEPRRRIGPPRWLRPVLAAAAVLAVGIGVSTYVEYQRGAPQRKLLGDNAPLVNAMAALHDGGASAAGDTLTSPLADPDALAAEASHVLGRTVPAPRIAGGWTLDAASISSVNGSKAARFHFVNAGQSLTLLSMPANLWYGTPGATDYSLLAQSHPIAGYVAAGSLNCVVGDRGMTLAESERLRDLLRHG